MNARNVIDSLGHIFIPMDPDEMAFVQNFANVPHAGLDALFLINKDITDYHNLKTEVPQEYLKKKVGSSLEGNEVGDEFYGFGRLNFNGPPAEHMAKNTGHYLMALKTTQGWVFAHTLGGNHGLNFLDALGLASLQDTVKVFLRRLGVTNPQIPQSGY